MRHWSRFVGKSASFLLFLQPLHILPLGLRNTLHSLEELLSSQPTCWQPRAGPAFTHRLQPGALHVPYTHGLHFSTCPANSCVCARLPGLTLNLGRKVLPLLPLVLLGEYSSSPNSWVIRSKTPSGMTGSSEPYIYYAFPIPTSLR